MRTVLFDIDHTLADAAWRDPLLGEPWDRYHAPAYLDAPIPHMVALCRSIKTSFTITGITLRPEKWRAMTTKWLSRNEIPIDELLMRPDQCTLSAASCKLALAVLRFRPVHRHVEFIVDNDESIIDAFQGIGVPALHARTRCLQR